MMAKRLKMELYSECELTPATARDQVQALSDFEGGVFRPSLCDTSEPVRERFNPYDLAEPVRWLSQAGADFKFKRLRPLRIEGYIRNRRRPQMWTRDVKDGPLVPLVPKFPEPHFLSSWTVWFDFVAVKSPGAEVLRRFLLDMFEVSRSEYGYLTDEVDQKAKNFSIVVGEGITTTRFVGTDPEFGIPGLYWINVFGRKCTRWLGRGLAAIPADVKTFGENSTLIQYSDSPDDCLSENVVERQKNTIGLLGESKFFDIIHQERKTESPFRNIVARST